MTVRARHGVSRARGAVGPAIEVLPIDELPRGIPAPEQMPPAKRHRGRIFTSERAKEIGKLGGKAKHGQTRLSSECSIEPGSPELAPYLKAATSFRRMHLRQLAQSVGGGTCGAGPASLIASAALQLAFSRHAFDRGKAELGSRLADASRQNLLAAHELCAREAAARPKRYAWDVTSTASAEQDESDDGADDADPDADTSGPSDALNGIVGAATGASR